MRIIGIILVIAAAALSFNTGEINDDDRSQALSGNRAAHSQLMQLEMEGY